MSTRVYKMLTAALGALLGPAVGCDDEAAGPGADEYGMPSGTYRMSGHVQADDGQPLEGIQIEVEQQHMASSGPDGNWTINRGQFPCERSCMVSAVDVDGADNGGEFLSETRQVDMQLIAPGDGVWDLGTWEAQDVDFELSRVAGSGGSGASGSQGGAGGG